MPEAPIPRPDPDRLKIIEAKVDIAITRVEQLHEESERSYNRQLELKKTAEQLETASKTLADVAMRMSPRPSARSLVALLIASALSGGVVVTVAHDFAARKFTLSPSASASTHP